MDVHMTYLSHAWLEWEDWPPVLPMCGLCAYVGVVVYCSEQLWLKRQLVKPWFWFRFGFPKKTTVSVLKPTQPYCIMTCMFLITVQVESQKQNRIQCLFGLLIMILTLTREVCYWASQSSYYCVQACEKVDISQSVKMYLYSTNVYVAS